MAFLKYLLIKILKILFKSLLRNIVSTILIININLELNKKQALKLLNRVKDCTFDSKIEKSSIIKTIKLDDDSFERDQEDDEERSSPDFSLRVSN